MVVDWFAEDVYWEIAARMPFRPEWDCIGNRADENNFIAWTKAFLLRRLVKRCGVTCLARVEKYTLKDAVAEANDGNPEPLRGLIPSLATVNIHPRKLKPGQHRKYSQPD